jgi:FMN-dependent NADH-azoreductase
VKVLHIDSSPLPAISVSRGLSARVVEGIRAHRPDATVIRRDVGLDPPLHASADILDVVRFKRLGSLNASQRREKVLSDALVTEVLAADILVIGAPMYNFTVSTQLKAWIDRVCQAGLTIRYTPDGPVGLATGKRAIVAASRGGIYTRERDFQLPYLRQILSFIGIAEVDVVLAEGVNISPERRAQALDQAYRDADSAAASVAALGLAE